MAVMVTLSGDVNELQDVFGRALTDLCTPATPPAVRVTIAGSDYPCKLVGVTIEGPTWTADIRLELQR